MKKRTCYIMIALMIGVIVSGTVFCVQMHRFTEIVYAKSAEDELAEELYCDSLELLAICVQAEAGNQPLIGRRMVADVILNRVDDPDWPDTIEGVITQRNAFTPYQNGRYDRVEPDADCWEALDLVMSGWDESQGALYFETTTDEETWHNTHLDRLFEHGALTFYKEK